MRNFFLLFVCIVLLLLLKESKSRVTTLEPLYIVKSQLVDFTGTLFIPKTLTVNDEIVKKTKLNVVTLCVTGNCYTYTKHNNNTFWITKEVSVKEVNIKVGDNITSSAPVKLFVLRELL